MPMSFLPFNPCTHTYLPVVVDDGALETLRPEHGELEDGLITVGYDEMCVLSGTAVWTA